MRLLRLINKTIEYGFYALLIVTPLLFNPIRQIPSYELFEFSKMMFVYVMTTIIVSAWLIRMIIYKKILFQRTPIDVPIFLFLGSQILATLFSIDRHVSLFGYYSRFHGGLLSTISYVTLYYAFVSNRKLVSINKLVSGALISGFFVAGYGILEHFGIDAHIWVQDVKSRVFSTLGQPNWLAAYLTILLPIGVYQYINFIKQQESGHAAKIPNFKFQIPNSDSNFKKLFSIWHLAFVIISYICLLFTKSRSGFLGFWIANAVFWGLTFYSSKSGKGGNDKNVSSRLGSNTIFRVFLILNFTFFILNFFIKTPIPGYNKLATVELLKSETAVESPPEVISGSVIDVGITDSAKIRQIVWTGAIDIIKNYPLFGTGPETFAFAYYKFRPSAHNLTSEWDFLYNRAHNEFLNMGATTGIVGLATYIFLIISVLYSAILKIIHNKKNPEIPFIIATLAAYLSISITNFFGFSVVIVGLFFFLLPTCIYGFGMQPGTFKEIKGTVTIPQKAIFTLIIIFGIGLLTTLGKFWAADSLYAKSYSLRRQESFSDAYNYIVTASTWRSDEPVYHDERATIAASLASLALSKQNATAAANFASEAIRESTIALTISPQNVNFWKSRTRIMYEFATLDPSFMTSALESITIAKELAPTDAKIAYNRAVLLGETQKIPEAISELENAVTLKPDYRDAYIALAIFYEQSDQKEKARQTLELILQRINPDDSEVKKRLEEIK